MNSKLIKSLAVIFVGAVLFCGAFSALANGGDQRVVEGKYLVNLSRAPFTPRVGVKTSFLASIVDIQQNKLVQKEVTARVRIAKLTGGPQKREFIYEEKDIKVQSGVFEFAYMFNKPGLHEVFFDFVLASNPDKMYEPPDFLIDVQDQAAENSTKPVLIGVIMGLSLGFGISLLLKKRIKA